MALSILYATAAPRERGVVGRGPRRNLGVNAEASGGLGYWRPGCGPPLGRQVRPSRPPLPLTPRPARNIMGRQIAGRCDMRVALVLTLMLVAACAAQAATVVVGAKESPQKGPWCGT